MTNDRHVILVVDDEESMRHFLQKTLRREGYEVVTARDGPEALEVAQRQPPDVALVDVRMPGMDGVAVLRALRSMLPHLPVVLMTGFGTVQNALHAMKQGATDYITKPFRVEAVRTTVEKAIARGPGTGSAPTLRRALPGDDAGGGAGPALAPPAGALEVPERGVVAYLREQVAARRLPVTAGGGEPETGLREVARLAELVYVDELLRLTEGNISRAAEIAGITRPNMHRKIVDLGLSADAYRT